MTDPERDFSDEPTIDEKESWREENGKLVSVGPKCPACGHEERYHCGAIDCPRPERPPA